MLDSIFGASASDSAITPAAGAAVLASALVFGLALAAVRMRTRGSQPVTPAFAHTLALLPLIIAVIIMLVGNSTARAFSLAGAFTLIRFRSAPGNPKDITYVLLASALGLCCGMGSIVFGAIAAAVSCSVMLILEAVRFGQAKTVLHTLSITMPENLDFSGEFNDILAAYTESFECRKVRTADLGSLYIVSWLVSLKAGADVKAFLDELRCRNGNLTVTLALAAGDTQDF